MYILYIFFFFRMLFTLRPFAVTRKRFILLSATRPARVLSLHRTQFIVYKDARHYQAPLVKIIIIIIGLARVSARNVCTYVHYFILLLPTCTYRPLETTRFAAQLSPPTFLSAGRRFSFALPRVN